MTYTIVSQDLLILYGLIALFIYDPLSPPRAEIVAQYATLRRRIPGAVQSPAVFGIAWTALYLLMATSVFLLYLERADVRPWTAYAAFGVVGGMVATSKLWTLLFFGLPRSVGPGAAHALALADWAVLLACVVCYIVFTALADPAYPAGCIAPPLLMAPTLLWLIYAGYLNAAALAVDLKWM